MKKLLAIGLIALLAGCSAPTTAPESAPSAISHFYPMKNGTRYTYVRFNYGTRGGSIDTEVYETAVALRVEVPSRLVLSGDKSTPPHTLYNFAYDHDQNGVRTAILWDSTFRQIVLKGDLQINSSWVADASTNMEATVVDHFAEYYLPDHKVSYQDVVVVRYQKQTDPASTYLLRFFARDRGMILERYFIGENSAEIANLQLVKFETSNSSTAHGVVKSDGLKYYLNRDAGQAVWNYDPEIYLR